MAKLTVRRVAEAIRLYKGNVSAVAQSFERSRTAVYNFVRRHPELAEALNDADDSQLSAIAKCKDEYGGIG